MTAFRSLLNDDELAAVLTFVRNTWGNKASPVSPAMVKKVRQESKSRTTFWDPKELLAEHPMEAEFAETNGVGDSEEVVNLALEAELMKTPVLELAKAAVERGNAGRGKQVFYQSAAACFACHDPPRGVARLGPDLARMAGKLTNEQLVDSILRPSALIDKDFAQVKVATEDGETLTGIRVSEDEKELVLRNLAEPDPIKIAQDNIEVIAEAKLSLMPENLVRQLKSRQEFDDLMKYIIEIRKRK